MPGPRAILRAIPPVLALGVIALWVLTGQLAAQVFAFGWEIDLEHGGIYAAQVGPFADRRSLLTTYTPGDFTVEDIADTTVQRWKPVRVMTASGDTLVVVAFWFPVALLMAPSVLGVILRSRRESRAGLCPACGYDLRATPERCPECGRTRDMVDVAD